jgi:predicted nuclease of restriction endonuclease-like (RecB) superfamily
LARDIALEFPGAKGFSYRNLKYMSQFAATYPHLASGQQAVAHLPWGHNILLMAKVHDAAERLLSSARALEHG